MSRWHPGRFVGVPAIALATALSLAPMSSADARSGVPVRVMLDESCWTAAAKGATVTTSGVRRVYGGVTGEERVAERRRKLIEAGLNAFGSASSGTARVKDVVGEAGLTERYFYESFSDLGALFDAVLDRTMEAIETEVNAAVANAPGDGFARVSIALRTTVDSLVSDPRMIRIVFIEALGKGGRAGSRRNDILVRSAENFFTWSGNDDTSFESSPPEARMRALAISGAASELLISWAEGILDVTPAELTDFLVGLYWRTNLP